MLRSLRYLVTFILLVTIQPAVANPAFAERYGIFFMFESMCGSCIRFAPTLQRLTDKHNIYVHGISRDGKGIPTWHRHWTPDKNGTLYRLGLEEVPTPALVLQDSHTQTQHYIGVGVMTEAQLIERLYQLTHIKLEGVQ